MEKHSSPMEKHSSTMEKRKEILTKKRKEILKKIQNIYDRRNVNQKKLIESTTTKIRRPWEDLSHNLLQLMLKAILEPIDRPNPEKLIESTTTTTTTMRRRPSCHNVLQLMLKAILLKAILEPIDRPNPEKMIESTTTTTTTSTMRRRPSWEDLPHHLLELFLKAILEPIDRPNLSRVCKAWREFKPTQSSLCFPALVHGPTISNNKFILKGGGGGVDDDDDDDDDDDEYPIRSCLASSHGWLIITMRKSYKHPDELYYLLNMFTKDTIQLPTLRDHRLAFPKICLSSSPSDDPDCIILMFDNLLRGFLYSKRGWNKWIKSDCKYPFYPKPADEGIQINIYSVFPFQGKFYALTLRGNLVAIDINVNALLLLDNHNHHHPKAKAKAKAPPNTMLTVLPVNSIFPVEYTKIGYEWIQSPSLGYTRIPYDWFLIESLEKLLAVRLYRREKHGEIINLDVLVLDFETMSWITVENLPGDQVLFIGLCSSFSISGSEIGIGRTNGNCIYVSDYNLSKIHRYNMHNQEMMVCTDYPMLDEDWRFEYRRLWVKPTFV